MTVTRCEKADAAGITAVFFILKKQRRFPVDLRPDGASLHGDPERKPVTGLPGEGDAL